MNLPDSSSPKPAFTALKNLIALLRDDGSAFKAASLSYSLNGYVNNLHHTLLQKRDGSFYLALWVEGYNWDPNAKVELTSPVQQVVLTVDSPLISAFYCVANEGTKWRNAGISNNKINLVFRINICDVLQRGFRSAAGRACRRPGIPQAAAMGQAGVYARGALQSLRSR